MLHWINTEDSGKIVLQISFAVVLKFHNKPVESLSIHLKAGWCGEEKGWDRVCVLGAMLFLAAYGGAPVYWIESLHLYKLNPY